MVHTHTLVFFSSGVESRHRFVFWQGSHFRMIFLLPFAFTYIFLVGGLVHAWVGQIVTFFAYRPPSRPLGSLRPTQPGRVTNPTQAHPGPPWEAPQAECRSLRREPKPPA